MYMCSTLQSMCMYTVPVPVCTVCVFVCVCPQVLLHVRRRRNTIGLGSTLGHYASAITITIAHCGLSTALMSTPTTMTLLALPPEHWVWYWRTGGVFVQPSYQGLMCSFLKRGGGGGGGEWPFLLTPSEQHQMLSTQSSTQHFDCLTHTLLSKMNHHVSPPYYYPSLIYPYFPFSLLPPPFLPSSSLPLFFVAAGSGGPGDHAGTQDGSH